MRASTIFMLGGAALLTAVGCAKRATRPSANEHETSAVTSVEVGRVNGGPVSLEELLKGKVAGLQFVPSPDGGTTIRIRGAEPIHEPLILVDGIETSPRDLHSALAGLTRDDIQKVQVLKDVASTSGYGMRGVGGVILISTRKR